MKKAICLLLSLLMLVSAFMVPAFADGEYTVTLKVDCEENLMFSKYDVEIYMDNEFMGVLGHGKYASADINVSSGSHTVYFYEEGDHSVKGKLDFDVQGETIVSCEIHCKNNKIKVDEISISGNKDNAFGSAPVKAFGSSSEPEVNVEDRTTNPAPTDNEIGVTKYTKDKIAVTLLSYRTSKGSDWFSPDAGNVFVFPMFELSNEGKNECAFSSLMFVTAYCDDYKVDYSFSASCESKGTLDGTVAAGKKLKGEYGIEVPSYWHTIQVDIQTSFGSDTVSFTFRNDK